MTESWYSTPDRIAALDTAAQSWLGTPFMANSAVPGPGGGVSCHNLVAELHFATGRLPRFSVPVGYSPALIHGDPDYLIKKIDGSLLQRGFCAVDDVHGLRLPGDLLIVRYGRVAHHLVTMLSGGLCVHVLRDTGVVVTPLLAALMRTTKHTVTIAAARRPSTNC